jgi:glycosyltransferase involved in cell wall biosynthesis
VATDVPGVRTVVEDGKTGVVVEVENTAAMVRAVAGLVVDADQRRTMGAAARRRCLDQFSLGAVADRWMGVLAPLLPATAQRR